MIKYAYIIGACLAFLLALTFVDVNGPQGFALLFQNIGLALLAVSFTLPNKD